MEHDTQKAPDTTSDKRESEYMNDSEITRIRKMFLDGVSISDIAKEVGHAYTTVYDIAWNKRYSSSTYAKTLPNPKPRIKDQMSMIMALHERAGFTLQEISEAICHYDKDNYCPSLSGLSSAVRNWYETESRHADGKPKTTKKTKTKITRINKQQGRGTK